MIIRVAVLAEVNRFAVPLCRMLEIAYGETLNICFSNAVKAMRGYHVHQEHVR
jgi:hypothetical protein